MKNLKLFSTLADYESQKIVLDAPNVCYVEESTEAKFMKENPYKEYFTFVALADTTITVSGIKYNANLNITSISYSLDDGNTWVTTEAPTSGTTAKSITTPTITAGNKVIWKGIADNLGIDQNNSVRFSATGYVEVYGNIISLFKGDDFI